MTHTPNPSQGQSGELELTIYGLYNPGITDLEKDEFQGNERRYGW